MVADGVVAPRATIEVYLVVDDGKAAIDFYRRAFDARVIQQQLGADGRVRHCSLAVFGGTVMLADEFPEQVSDTLAPKTIGGTAVTIHVNLRTADEVDHAAAEAAKAGGSITTSPVDAPWGVRCARLIDPFGHAWSFAAPIVIRTA